MSGIQGSACPKQASSGSERGFTIIELMIATSILSTILVLTTAMMINIGNLYYKGVSQSRIQQNARSITEDISQHLELNGGNVISTGPGSSTAPQAYCIGTVRYNYILGRQIGSDASKNQVAHVLWRDNVPSGDCSALTLAQLNSSTPTDGGTELILSNSRLTAFTITPLTTPYTLSIGVAYGDSDLLTGSGLNTLCQGGIGQQFCATAHLTVTVAQRLTSH